MVKSSIISFFLSLILFSCGDNEIANDVKPNNNYQEIETLEEENTTEVPLTFEDAFQQFSTSFEIDSENYIDTNVMNTLFPAMYFGNTIEPKNGYNLRVDNNIKGYVFRDGLIVYLAVFNTKDSIQLVQINDLLEDGVKGVEFNYYYGNRSVIVECYVDNNFSASYYIINDNSKIVEIKDLKANQVPERDDQFMMGSEILFDNRYLVVETATDIVGDLKIYDLKTESFCGSFIVSSGSYKYNNDTLKFKAPGATVGDSLGLDKLLLYEYVFTDGKIVDTLDAGFFLMH